MGAFRYCCNILSAIAFVNMAIGVFTISKSIENIALKYSQHHRHKRFPPELALVSGLVSFITGSFCFYFARRASKCSFLTYLVIAFLCIWLGMTYLIVGIVEHQFQYQSVIIILASIAGFSISFYYFKISKEEEILENQRFDRQQINNAVAVNHFGAGQIYNNNNNNNNNALQFQGNNLPYQPVGPQY